MSFIITDKTERKQWFIDASSTYDAFEYYHNNIATSDDNDIEIEEIEETVTQ